MEYTFEGTGNDSSGNGEHLALMGDATYASGMFGQALSLDGSGDYGIVDIGALSLSTFTLETWVKRPSYVSGGHYISLYSDHYLVLGDWGTNAASTWADGLSPIDAASSGSFAPPAADTWMHLAFTYDGSVQRVYVNGDLKVSAATTGTLADDNIGDLVVGARYNSGSQFVTGLMDNVRIHDVALSAPELGWTVDQASASAVPLPAAAPLLAVGLGGLGGLGFVARRRRRS
ncbi:LamG domain-containing protein [Albimonas donghaensis]|uniref:LamG domain-containing protein n=1 Tax=Albimonas donghaensis TaxID=356660 RepID=UPI0015A0065B|nr:LamG domain-containing protein [Albimonas donghaensis]